MAAAVPLVTPLEGVELLHKIQFARVLTPPSGTPPLEERLVPFVAARVSEARHLAPVLRLIGNHMHLLEGPHEKSTQHLKRVRKLQIVASPAHISSLAVESSSSSAASADFAVTSTNFGESATATSISISQTTLKPPPSIENQVLLCRLPRFIELGGRLMHDNTVEYYVPSCSGSEPNGTSPSGDAVTSSITTTLTPESSATSHHNQQQKYNFASFISKLEPFFTSRSSISDTSNSKKYIIVQVPETAHHNIDVFRQESATVWPMNWILPAGSTNSSNSIIGAGQTEVICSIRSHNVLDMGASSSSADRTAANDLKKGDEGDGEGGAMKRSKKTSEVAWTSAAESNDYDGVIAHMEGISSRNTRLSGKGISQDENSAVGIGDDGDDDDDEDLALTRYFLEGMQHACDAATKGKRAGFVPRGAAICLPIASNDLNGSGSTNISSSSSNGRKSHHRHSRIDYILRGVGYSRTHLLSLTTATSSSSSSSSSPSSSSSTMQSVSHTTSASSAKIDVSIRCYAHPLKSAALVAIEQAANFDKQVAMQVAAASGSSSGSTTAAASVGVESAADAMTTKNNTNNGIDVEISANFTAATAATAAAAAAAAAASTVKPLLFANRRPLNELLAFTPSSSSSSLSSSGTTTAIMKRQRTHEEQHADSPTLSSVPYMANNNHAISSTNTNSHDTHSNSSLANVNIYHHHASSPPLPLPSSSSSSSSLSALPAGMTLDALKKSSLYICTGADAFLTHEPNLADAMALVHSRVSRIIYALPNNKDGALQGRNNTIKTTKADAGDSNNKRPNLMLQEVRALNHHYTVWRITDLDIAKKLLGEAAEE